METKSIINGFKTAESRWARFGPYYAMFPVDFAFNVVEKFSKKGDSVLDPFAGRYSSIYASSVLGRKATGIEINPVGWLYGRVKINPAVKEEVLERLNNICELSSNYQARTKSMPEFYHLCYCQEVLAFLLAARDKLNWKNDDVDATLMAILLVYLHGKLGEGLSNQMRMSKSMGMNYSVDWWKKNNFSTPPLLDPLEFISKKINWRYAKGLPKITESRAILGDSTKEIKKLNKEYSLLFTSPPYCSVTDYHADQWLRLWLLGGTEIPQATKEKHKGRFVNKDNYYSMLDKVFGDASKVMKKNSVVYVRTDRRDFTLNATVEILSKYFPRHKLEIKNKPFEKRTQTSIHGNSSTSKGEVDLILTR